MAGPSVEWIRDHRKDAESAMRKFKDASSYALIVADKFMYTDYLNYLIDAICAIEDYSLYVKDARAEEISKVLLAIKLALGGIADHMYEERG